MCGARLLGAAYGMSVTVEEGVFGKWGDRVYALAFPTRSGAESTGGQTLLIRQVIMPVALGFP